MKTRTATAALALLFAAGVSHAALAQDDDHRGRGPRGDHATAQAPQQAPQQAPRAEVQPRGPDARQPSGAPASRASLAAGFREQREQREQQNVAPQPRPDRGAPPAARDPRAEGDRRDQNWDRNRGPDRNDDHRGDRGDRRDWGDRGGPRPGGPGFDPRRGDGGERHWERGRYPPVYQSDRRFRISPYRYPRGFYNRAWVFGDILPRGWFGSDYLLGDFYDYGLPYPPPGYDWVRVGPDALMIDRYTGRIVQVVRYIFY